MLGCHMTGAALGHAVSHVEEDFEVPRVVGQEKAGEGGVALERVVILIVVQTIKHTHTLTHTPARAPRAHHSCTHEILLVGAPTPYTHTYVRYLCS